jgi:3-oxoacid CoA-transferase A subunit
VQTPFEKGVASGDLVLELVPQGTLAERIRAGRAGIPAFYTPTGPGTIAAEDKESREFDGRTCLLERAIYGDFSLIRAHKADRYGNLVYRGTSRTFNATMAGASRVTIAEVDEVVEVGELDPEAIVTPGLYVQRVVVRPEPVEGPAED